jgi:hypothetical protein
MGPLGRRKPFTVLSSIRAGYAPSRAAVVAATGRQIAPGAIL